MTGDPRRLLIYVDTNLFAGAEQSVQTLITHLPPALAVTVVGPDRNVLDRMARYRPGAVVMEAPPFRDKSTLGNAPALWRLVSKLEPSVVHLNKTEVADLRYVELLLRFRRLGPIVSVVHHVERPRTFASRILTRFLARRAASVVAVNDRVGRRLERYLGLSPGSVTVVPNALPVVERPCQPVEIGSAHRPFTVGVLARLIPHKGVADVITAIAPLPDVQLVIGGDGPMRQSLEQLTWTLKLAERVEFPGWVDPDEVFDRCDIMVSAAHIEGHSMALLDARRRGVPIVAADVGGVSAIVDNGETGFLVPPYDPPALSQAIEQLRTSPHLRRDIKRAALAASRTSPGPSDMAEQYCRLYWPTANR